MNSTTNNTLAWLQSPIDNAIAGLMASLNISRQEAGLIYAAWLTLHEARQLGNHRTDLEM